jgi:hypothetical protein
LEAHNTQRKREQASTIVMTAEKPEGEVYMEAFL